MNIPNHIFDKIMLFNSHPTADIMRNIILKYKDVLIMRNRNVRCSCLSFYITWCNIELDQVKINKTMKQLMQCRYSHLEFDF